MASRTLDSFNLLQTQTIIKDAGNAVATFEMGLLRMIVNIRRAAGALRQIQGKQWLNGTQLADFPRRGRIPTGKGCSDPPFQG
jgi:hypothetical protein